MKSDDGSSSLLETLSETNTVPDTEALAEQNTNTDSGFIALPENVGYLSATSRLILEELQVKHRKQKTQNTKGFGSQIMTLEEIPPALSAHQKVPEHHKTNQAIAESLSELTDEKGGFRKRSVYIYPIFKKELLPESPKIALICAQSKKKESVDPFRNSCFSLSKQNLIQLIETASERRADSFLSDTQGTNTNNYNPFIHSFEFYLESILRRAFQPIKYIPMPDFFEDVLELGNSYGILKQIVPGYHIALKDFTKNTSSGKEIHPVLLSHLEVQSKSFEKYAVAVMKEIGEKKQYLKFLDDIKQFEAGASLSSPDPIQNLDQIRILMELVSRFPFSREESEEGKLAGRKCNEASQILTKLISLVESALSAMEGGEYERIKNNLFSRIDKYSSEELGLYPINFLEEVESITSGEDAKTQASQKLKESLQNNYGCIEDSGVFYALNPSLLSEIIANLEEKKKESTFYGKQFKLVLEIRKLLNESNKSKKKSTENKTGMTAVAESIGENDVFEKNQKLILIGLVGFILSIVFYFLLSELGFAAAFFIIILIGLAGYFFYASLKKKQETNSRKSNDKPLDTNNRLAAIETSERISSLVFSSATSDSVADKITDLKKLKKQILVSLPEVRANIPKYSREKDDVKLANLIEKEILSISSIIQVNSDVEVATKPNALVIKKSDLKSKKFREKLAKYFREEKALFSGQRDMERYFSFLANAVEINFNQYLRKR